MPSDDRAERIGRSLRVLEATIRRRVRGRLERERKDDERRELTEGEADRGTEGEG